MIIRYFRAKIHPGKEALWQEKVRDFSIPWLRAQEGLIDYYPGKPLAENGGEFSMVSIWKDIESLKTAVGEDFRKVVLLEDEAELVEEIRSLWTLSTKIALGLFSPLLAQQGEISPGRLKPVTLGVRRGDTHESSSTLQTIVHGSRSRLPARRAHPGYCPVWRRGALV
jgi:quinol monooxygenase YgiN